MFGGTESCNCYTLTGSVFVPLTNTQWHALRNVINVNTCDKNAKVTRALQACVLSSGCACVLSESVRNLRMGALVTTCK